MTSVERGIVGVLNGRQVFLASTCGKVTRDFDLTSMDFNEHHVTEPPRSPAAPAALASWKETS